MIDIDEKLRSLQPVLGTMKVARLRQMYFFSDDFREKKEIENYIDLLISRHVKTQVEDIIILPPPASEQCAGDIDIGKIEYLGKQRDPFALKLKGLTRHLGVFGSTGSGKTTFAKHLIRKLHGLGIPFLVFDWEKSYRDLIKEFDDIQVFTVGSDINPLFLNFLNVPPGITPDEYIKSVIAIISEDYVGGIGADTMLLNYMEMAFQETKNPYFEDLKQIFQREITKDKGRFGRLSGRSGLWKESVGRQLNFLSKGASGSIVNKRKHFPLDQLFSKHIVLEFGNLKSPYDRRFFIHVILNWLSIYNQHCGIQSEILKQVLIFEEFHNIAMKKKQDSMDMVSNLFRESRKFGIGLVAIDQTPSEIGNAIYANINAKVSFTLTTAKDINSMAKAMNLGPHQNRFLGMLETGQAIINVKQRGHESFVIRPPRPIGNQEENVWDEELREAMKRFTAVHSPNQPSFENSSSSQVPQRKDTLPPLEPLEKIFLTDVTGHPFDGVDDRTKRLGLHSSNVSKIHISLVEKGIISTAIIDQKKLFDLTTEGRICAESIGLNVRMWQSKGGLEHAYWINEIVQFLRKHEFQPVCEKDNIDIVESIAGIAIEVETGKSDITGNLVKLENHSSSAKFMLATSKPVEIKIRELARKFPAVKVLFIKDFLKLTIDQIIPATQK